MICSYLFFINHKYKLSIIYEIAMGDLCMFDRIMG
jgi:hypothetical protein